MVKSPYRPTSDSYGDRCGMLVTVVFSCTKHEAITSLWTLLEKPFDNLHFLQNISQKIQSLWEYLWGTILMARSGTFVYMRYASAVGLLPWECEMGWSQTWCQHCDVTSECEKIQSLIWISADPGLILVWSSGAFSPKCPLAKWKWPPRTSKSNLPPVTDVVPARVATWSKTKCTNKAMPSQGVCYSNSDEMELNVLIS